MSDSGHQAANVRTNPPASADEPATLIGFLEYQRATLAWKCSDLTDQQLRQPLSPTNMSLAGLLAHMGTVEDFWFSQVMAEQPFPIEHWPAAADNNPEWEWGEGADLGGDDLRQRWSAACDRSRLVLESESDLGTTHHAYDGEADVSSRWILTHMIEEYARHNGHADLLRESIDGAVGE